MKDKTQTWHSEQVFLRPCMVRLKCSRFLAVITLGCRPEIHGRILSPANPVTDESCHRRILSPTNPVTDGSTSAAPATQATQNTLASASGDTSQRSGPWLARPQPLDLAVDQGESFRIRQRRWDMFCRLSNLHQAMLQMQHDIFLMRVW